MESKIFKQEIKLNVGKLKKNKSFHIVVLTKVKRKKQLKIKKKWDY